MASRSEKLRRRQRRKEKKRKPRWAPAEARDPGPAIVFNPRGEAKMSEALLALLEPELAQVADEADMEKLLTLGVTAWNASLLDSTERTAFLESLAPTSPPEIRQDLRQLLEALIRRKAEQLPHIRRPILSFKLTQTAAGEPYVSVISGLEPVTENAGRTKT
jgi:hypothetical protein